MTVIQNHTLQGKHNKPIIADAFFKGDGKAKPVIIFCHGYKGFKDWGAWNLMSKAFISNGFAVVKFNFSHNGGTVAQPIDFPDLEAFGNNNYTKELDDLETVIDWVSTHTAFTPDFDRNNITLIGHSRGGGIVCIKAAEDARIHQVITLAGVADYKKRTATTGELEQWKKNGVKYVMNGRTKQMMPHYYQFYEDFIQNETRLTIKRAIQDLTIPHLIIHGDADTSIMVEEAMVQHKWNPNSKLKIIAGANHVFGAKHPWDRGRLPEHLQEVVTTCVDFLNERH